MNRIVTACSVAAILIAGQALPDLVAAKPETAPVEVVVWNIRHAGGHIRVGLCNRATFINPKKQCPYHADALAVAGETVVVVPDVPAGNYAAQVFQDVHDDHRVRRGILGWPLVGIGFSNDAPTPMAAPRFEDAAFDHDPGLAADAAD